MNPETTSTAPSSSIEDGMKSMIHDVKEKASGAVDTYERKVRASPEKALLIAAAAGYCLHVLPTRSLLAVPLKLTLFLAKPALLALGATKLCEIVQQARK